jgi:ADP-heptose:LPS heptosyltransferase
MLSGQRPRVGIAWSGSEHHKHDRARSIAFALMRELLNEPGIDFFSLQRDVRRDDADLLAASPNIIHLGHRFDDFADTAAAVEQIDLVISVDTAVAHLAGAMGKPAWVLLPYWPDFRWLQEREDSPWYPTIRLFRQSRIADWRTSIGRMRTELRHWTPSSRAPGTPRDRLPGRSNHG